MDNIIRILPKIHTPDDVKHLKFGCLGCLAEEMRQTIIETTAKNGGHLASNLGMVELTIALHRVFNCTCDGGKTGDAIVFDVSHQAYAHKLLTGRYEKFHTLRQSGGLSGFTNREESAYDVVTAGHSGSAISTAIGIAEANRIRRKNSWVVAVVGDGSFTNGMVYEALNQLAAKKLRLILVLNDNEMSISKNVGGLSEYLAYIRTSEGYFNLKCHTRQAMERIPYLGTGLLNATRHVKNVIKRITNAETWFESFGLDYIGPANGNNIAQMITVLNEAKKKNCPVVVHVRTKKGLGYAPSEEHPENYHSIGAFQLTSGDAMEPITKKFEEPKQNFTQLVETELVRAARENEKICAITAAMTAGCGLSAFAEQYPERFFDVGIAEEHQIAMAGGLSIAGMLPVAVLYSTFSQRVFDQMWHDVALQGAKAVFLFSHAGLVPGDGITHQGIYDNALFRRLPDVRIYSPDSFEEWRKDFTHSLKYKGISILRYPKGREAVYPDEICWTGTAKEFTPYKTCVIGDGEKNMLLLTYGRITENVIRAVLAVLQDAPGWRFTVIALEQIAPLPLDDALLELLHSADKVLFVEEHIRSGGTAEALTSDDRVNRRIAIAAIEDTHVPHGELNYLMKFCGLDVDSIRDRIYTEISHIGKLWIEMK